MRTLPDQKPTSGYQMAGGGFSTDGGGGGGGSHNKKDLYFLGYKLFNEGEPVSSLHEYTVEKEGYYLISFYYRTDGTHTRAKILINNSTIFDYAYPSQGKYQTFVYKLNENDVVKFQSGMDGYTQEAIYNITCAVVEL